MVSMAGADDGERSGRNRKSVRRVASPATYGRLAAARRAGSLTAEHLHDAQETTE
jgi:hypothetical protein